MIPAEYGVLVVSLWLAVAAGTGLYVLICMIRRQSVPMTPLIVAFSMVAGGLAFFPDIYMAHSLVVFLKLFTVFIIIDLIVMSLVLRFRKKPQTA